jgi:hypothetical protein
VSLGVLLVLLRMRERALIELYRRAFNVPDGCYESFDEGTKWPIFKPVMHEPCSIVKARLKEITSTRCDSRGERPRRDAAFICEPGCDLRKNLQQSCCCFLMSVSAWVDVALRYKG